jgi:hypothetical protein
MSEKRISAPTEQRKIGICQPERLSVLMPVDIMLIDGVDDACLGAVCSLTAVGIICGSSLIVILHS